MRGRETERVGGRYRERGREEKEGGRERGKEGKRERGKEGDGEYLNEQGNGSGPVEVGGIMKGTPTPVLPVCRVHLRARARERPRM